jgi:hypothetical protein
VASPPLRYRPLFERFVQGPSGVRAAVDGITASALNQRPAGREWSVRDLVVAEADAELLLAVQVRLTLAGEAPELPVADVTAWKRRHQYLWRDVDAALSLIALVRHTTAELLSHVDAPGWERTGIAAGAPASIAALVEGAAARTEETAERIRAARAPAVRG